MFRLLALLPLAVPGLRSIIVPGLQPTLIPGLRPVFLRRLTSVGIIPVAQIPRLIAPLRLRGATSLSRDQLTALAALA